MSDVRRQALIVEFKKVIAELEGTMEARNSHHQQPPTPPPRPSAGIPRNRDMTGATARTGSPAAAGLYGADVVDGAYWRGFDQTYLASSLDKTEGDIGCREYDEEEEEDSRTRIWRAAMGKWVEKGVGVMRPLDEESLGSTSSASVSPLGNKKGVRWNDEVG